MIVQRFVRWCETATSRQRAEGYGMLTRSILQGSVVPCERDAAMVVLHLVLDDPSPKVRLAVARELARAEQAPRSLLKLLLLDIDEVAVEVAGSPSLITADLVEAVRGGTPALRAAIAARADLPASVATAIASLGDRHACETLARNDGAVLSPTAFRQLSDRYGCDAGVRTRMLARDDLPADIRQTLILETGRSLESSSFVLAVLGEGRTRRVAFEACERGTAKIGEWVAAEDIPALVEHLRVSGQISPAFLLRAACAGNVDLLAAAFAALSGLSERRVRAIVVDGRDNPFLSMAKRCGLDGSTAALVRLAILHWKEIATNGTSTDIAEMPEYVMERVMAAFRERREGRSDETVALLARLEREAARDAAQARLTRLLAA